MSMLVLAARIGHILHLLPRRGDSHPRQRHPSGEGVLAIAELGGELLAEASIAEHRPADKTRRSGPGSSLTPLSLKKKFS